MNVKHIPLSQHSPENVQTLHKKTLHRADSSFLIIKDNSFDKALYYPLIQMHLYHFNWRTQFPNALWFFRVWAIRLYPNFVGALAHA